MWTRVEFLDLLSRRPETFGNLSEFAGAVACLLKDDLSVLGFAVYHPEPEDAPDECWSLNILTDSAVAFFVPHVNHQPGTSRRHPLSLYGRIEQVAASDLSAKDPDWLDPGLLTRASSDTDATFHLRTHVVEEEWTADGTTTYFAGAKWLKSWNDMPSALALEGVRAFWEGLLTYGAHVRET